MSDFTTYPLGHVVGVVDGSEQVAAVAAALQAMGRQANDLKVLSGARGTARLDAHGRRGGLLHFISRRVLAYGPEGEQLAAYERAVANGHTACAVAVTDGPDKKAVVGVFRAHRARLLHHYRRLTVEDLSTA